MADVTADIKIALDKHLSEIVGLPDVAWENVPFEPETGTNWVQPRFTPNRRRQQTMGTQFLTRYDGLYRVHVHTPEGQGAKAAQDIAATIVEAFEATTNLEHNGTKVQIRGSETRSGVHDAPWYYITVVVDWYCYK